MGFNQTEVTVSESEGTFNVYVEVFSPDPGLVDSSFFAPRPFSVMAIMGNATGNSYVQI